MATTTVKAVNYIDWITWGPLHVHLVVGGEMRLLPLELSDAREQEFSNEGY